MTVYDFKDETTFRAVLKLSTGLTDDQFKEFAGIPQTYVTASFEKELEPLSRKRAWRKLVIKTIMAAVDGDRSAAAFFDSWFTMSTPWNFDEDAPHSSEQKISIKALWKVVDVADYHVDTRFEWNQPETEFGAPVTSLWGFKVILENSIYPAQGREKEAEEAFRDTYFLGEAALVAAHLVDTPVELNSEEHEKSFALVEDLMKFNNLL